MTDEEFERLKAAEKEHLREKKRLQSQLKALKKQQRVQSVVEKMKHGAERLLSETESLVDALRGQFAKQEARLEVALNDEDERQETDEELRIYEEHRREKRAEALLQQYKASQSSSPRSPSPDETEDLDTNADASPDGPEKTIGRMRTPPSGTEEE